VSLVKLNQATLEGIAVAVSLAVSEDGKIVNLPLKVALSEELFAMYPAAIKSMQDITDEAAVKVLRREFDSGILQKDDFRRISELLTELRWMQACFTSFLPLDSKEYKLFKKKTDEIGRLHEKCENEAMK